MNALTLIETFAQFLTERGLHLETFAAHLRLGILSPKECWAFRRFAAISGGGTVGSDLKNALFFPQAQTIVPQTATSSVTGAGLDFDLCDGPLHAILQVGVVSGTSPTLDVKFQACDTTSGVYTDIGVPKSLHPTVTASGQCSVTDFKRPKRFVRALATIGGGSPSFAFSVGIFGVRKVQ